MNRSSDSVEITKGTSVNAITENKKYLRALPYNKCDVFAVFIDNGTVSFVRESGWQMAGFFLNII